MKEQDVILVNEQDEETGVMEKMKAHRQGLMHRAFSVFLFDQEGRLLLQQRAAGKYHGALLWSNTCCSHPYPGEGVESAAKRRLVEEMGISAAIKKIFSFTYRANVENDLVEHEYDHVFAGEYTGAIKLNPSEVADYRYADMKEVKRQLADRPEEFTTWFRIVFPRVEKWWQEHYSSKKEVK